MGGTGLRPVIAGVPPGTLSSNALSPTCDLRRPVELSARWLVGLCELRPSVGCRRPHFASSPCSAGFQPEGEGSIHAPCFPGSARLGSLAPASPTASATPLRWAGPTLLARLALAPECRCRWHRPSTRNAAERLRMHTLHPGAASLVPTQPHLEGREVGFALTRLCRWRRTLHNGSGTATAQSGCCAPLGPWHG